MLKHIMNQASKTLGFSFKKPDVVVCVPSGATSVERRAIEDAVKASGAKNVHLIEEPVAAVIGSDLPVDEPIANVIVDIGGGTSEAAIISYGGIVNCNTVRVGGDVFDDNIVQAVRKNYNLLIGERTAEEIKLEIGYALIDHEVKSMEVRGRDLVSGLPKTVTLTSTEIQEAMKESLLTILDSIKATLEECPAELSGDIVDLGIVLTGGGALLNGIQEWLSNEIIVPVNLAPQPLESVAIGTGKSLKYIDKLNK